MKTLDKLDVSFMYFVSVHLFLGHFCEVRDARNDLHSPNRSSTQIVVVN
jgi:hypothetical protein